MEAQSYTMVTGYLAIADVTADFNNKNNVWRHLCFARLFSQAKICLIKYEFRRNCIGQEQFVHVFCNKPTWSSGRADFSHVVLKGIK